MAKTATVFNEKGFAGTSFNDLITSTGLSKGCIYGHFESKDEIALAAFDYNRNRISNYFDSQMIQKDTIINQLLVYPQIIRRFPSIPAWQGGCPILNTSTEADDTHISLKQKAAEALSLWQDKIENQIKRGIESKEIKMDVNPKEIAILIVYLIESAVMQAKVSGSMSNLRIAMDFLEKTIKNLSS